MKLRCRHVVNEHSPLHKVNASISLICLSQLSKEFILFSQKKAFLIFWKCFHAPNLKRILIFQEGILKSQA